MTKTSSDPVVTGVIIRGTKRFKFEGRTSELAKKSFDRFELTTQFSPDDVKAAAKQNAATERARLEKERTEAVMGPVNSTSTKFAVVDPYGTHVAAALSGRPLQGQAKEANAEAGIPERNDEGRVLIPFPAEWYTAKATATPGQTELLLSNYDGENGPLDTVIQATGTGEYAPRPASVQVFGTKYPVPWLSRFGSMIMVPFGIRRIGFVTSPPTADERDEGDVTAPTDVEVSDNPLSPKRIDAVSNQTVELDALNPESYSVIQTELVMAVANQLELELLEDVATALAPPGTDPATTATFAQVASAASQFVDGRFAATESEVGILAPARFNTFASTVYQTSGDFSGLMRLKDDVGEYVVSKHLDDSTGSNAWTKDSGTNRFADVLAVAMRGRDALLCAMWPAMSIGVDAVTQRGAARILWATSLYSSHIETGTARSGALTRQRFKTA